MLAPLVASISLMDAPALVLAYNVFPEMPSAHGLHKVVKLAFIVVPVVALYSPIA